MYGKYALFNMMKTFKENKHAILSEMKGDTVEGYTITTNNAGAYLGMSAVMFMTVLLISLGIWIWALVVTIKYWDQIPPWAKVLALVGLLTGIGGPILSLVAVYIGKEQ